MVETFNSVTAILGTSLADVHTASTKSLTLLVQAVNNTASDVTCELYLTDDSHVIKAVVIPLCTLSAYGGVSDAGKHVILNGYKLYGMSDTAASVYVEVSVLEGIA